MINFSRQRLKYFHRFEIMRARFWFVNAWEERVQFDWLAGILVWTRSIYMLECRKIILTMNFNLVCVYYSVMLMYISHIKTENSNGLERWDELFVSYHFLIHGSSNIVLICIVFQNTLPCTDYKSRSVCFVSMLLTASAMFCYYSHRQPSWIFVFWR